MGYEDELLAVRPWRFDGVVGESLEPAFTAFSLTCHDQTCDHIALGPWAVRFFRQSRVALHENCMMVIQQGRDGIMLRAACGVVECGRCGACDHDLLNPAGVCVPAMSLYSAPTCGRDKYYMERENSCSVIGGWLT